MLPVSAISAANETIHFSTEIEANGFSALNQDDYLDTWYLNEDGKSFTRTTYVGEFVSIGFGAEFTQQKMLKKEKDDDK